jgi:hypothetical protein
MPDLRYQNNCSPIGDPGGWAPVQGGVDGGRRDAAWAGVSCMFTGGRYVGFMDNHVRYRGYVYVPMY